MIKLPSGKLFNFANVNNQLFAGFLLLLVLVFTACSSGDSISSESISDGKDDSVPSGVAIAYVNKGPVTDASCNLFNAAKNKLGGPVKSVGGVVTFSDVKLPRSEGKVLVECTGGTYTDEATGGTRTAPTLRGVANAESPTSATIIVTPFTELAVRKSKATFTDFFEQAEKIATAMGIPGVNISTVRPTDLNTTVAANDEAGKYATALAALSQLVKEGTAGSTLTAVLNTLNNAITDGVLSIVYNHKLRDAISNLPTSAVKNNLLTEVSNEIYDNLAKDITIPYIRTSSIEVAPSAPIVHGTNITFSGSGANLTTPSLITAVLSGGGDCKAVTLTGATRFTVNCLAPASGSTTIFSLTSTEQGSTTPSTIDGSDVSYSLVAVSTVPGAAASLSAVSPTSVAYNSTPEFTFIGYNFPINSTATFGGNACTSSANPTPNLLKFACVTSSDRTKSSDVLKLIIPNAAYTLDRTITYTAVPVVLQSASPASINLSAKAPSSWTINGSGLFTGLVFSFNGITCNNSGTATSNGASMIGVDCSNVTAPSSGTTANLTVSGNNLPSTGNILTLAIPLTSLPITTLAWTNGSTITSRINGSAITNKAYVTGESSANCISGSIVTYRLSTTPSSGVVTQANGVLSPISAADPTFVLNPGGTAGIATVTATTSGVEGVCASATSTFTLTVSELEPTVLNFANLSVTKNLDDDVGTYQQIATVTTPANGANITYSIDSQSPAGIATIDSNGTVSYSGAGTIVVKATASASGYSAGSKVYTLIINKGNVILSAPTTYSTVVANAVSNSITYSKRRTSAADPTGSITYSSSDTTVATITSTGLIEPKKVGFTTITYNYPGDANYNSNGPHNYTFTVNKALSSAVSMSWVSAPSTSLTYGQITTPSAKATQIGSGPVPTGTITYTTDGTVLEIASYTNGIPNVRAKSIGTGWVRATYDGDSNYNSGALIETSNIIVSKSTPTLSFATAYNAPIFMTRNSTAEVRVIITGVTGENVPTGTVTILTSNNNITTTNCSNVSLFNGEMSSSCTLTVPAGATTGNVNLYISYSGDNWYNTISDNTHVVSVTAGEPVTLTMRNANDDDITSGTIDLNATTSTPIKVRITRPTGNGNQPGGTVTFSSADTNIATVCTPAQVTVTWQGVYSESSVCQITQVGAAGNTGTTTINASYSGDGNFSGGTTSVTVNSR